MRLPTEGRLWTIADDTHRRRPLIYDKAVLYLV